MLHGCGWPWGGLVLLVLSGCCTPARLPAIVGSLKPIADPAANDLVVIDFAILEAPPGDRHLDEGVWANADEGVVAPELRGRLDDNGLRVGLFGGMQRASLQPLLDSPRSNRDPHRLQLHAGSPKPLAIGDDRASIRFQLQSGGSPQDVAFGQARCIVQVTPTAAPGGVKLAFEPQVIHGNRAPWPHLTDSGALSLAADRPTERYAALGFAVTVAEAEYVVIGTRFSRSNTYGWQCFVDPTAERPVQRMLVIRARRADGDALGAADVVGIAGPARYAARGSAR